MSGKNRTKIYKIMYICTAIWNVLACDADANANATNANVPDDYGGDWF